jgi:predicted metal-dependent enzyme (double-stranded beta helix superfamily)
MSEITPIDSLAARLRRCRSLDDMQHEVVRLQLDPVHYRPHVRFDPAHYTRKCLYRDDRVEIALLCWSPGQISPAHDHGRSRGWTVVLEGELTTWGYQRVAARAPVPAGARTWSFEDGSSLVDLGITEVAGPGSLAAFDDEEVIHRVGNASASGPGAVSLNIYVPPITSYLVYDLDAGRIRPIQMA